MTIVCEAVSVPLAKDLIEFTLQCFGPNTEVVGSRLTEDGFDLILEGPSTEVAALVWAWGEGLK